MYNTVLINSCSPHDAHLMGFDAPTGPLEDGTAAIRAQKTRGGVKITTYTIHCDGEAVHLSDAEAVAIARAILQDHETLKAAEAGK